MALKLFELLGADDRRFSTYSWHVRMLDLYDGLAHSVTAYPESSQDRDAMTASPSFRDASQHYIGPMEAFLQAY